MPLRAQRGHEHGRENAKVADVLETFESNIQSANLKVPRLNCVRPTSRFKTWNKQEQKTQ